MRMQNHLRSAMLAASVDVLICAGPNPADAQTAIDKLIERGQGPADISPKRAYSDYSDPLGRFMDALAAGAYAEARSLQSDACASWLTSRQTTALSGKFGVGNSMVDIDAICMQH